LRISRKKLVLLVIVSSVALLNAGGNKASAEIRLPHLLSDHAVLQRGGPIHIWGWNTPKASLTIRFHDQNISATSNKYGEWSAWLMPEQAGGPYSLIVDGGRTDGKKEVTDLLVGDVWIASGQSNMQMPLKGFLPGAPVKDSAREIAAASIPLLRLLKVGNGSSDIPQQDIGGGTWAVSSPKTAANFSAAAYFFGREIVAKENVPVGMIDSTVGGTPAEAWVSLDTLSSNPDLSYATHLYSDFTKTVSHLNAQIAAEKAEDEAATAAGRPKPQHEWHPNAAEMAPAGLYNAMIAPLAQAFVRGFLWYQGETEANEVRGPHYSKMLPALIQDWRTHFHQGDLPFLIVQIAGRTGRGGGWGIVRDAERRTLSLRNTAMAVTRDVAERDNSHPADKQTVGERLALAARGLVYGEKIPYASPLFREATTQPGGLRVWFDNADGLTANGKPLEGFELAGEDHHFVPATAKIENDTVVVTATGLDNPVYVRYAWSDFAPFSLYNSAGLPASTFSSEEIPVI